jgi:hypothetical protein
MVHTYACASAHSVVALVMHVLVWWVPSLVADAFCTSVLGEALQEDQQLVVITTL